MKTIKPSIGAWTFAIISLLLVIGLVIWLTVLGLFNFPAFVWLPFLLFWGVILFRAELLYLRSFVFDESGCKISFLFFSKKFSWEYYEIKEIEDCTKPFRRAFPYEKCVVFSKKKRKLTTWMDPGEYFAWFGDFSFVFLYYQPILFLGKYKDVSINEIDEKDFLTFLRGIGVEVANANSKFH